MIVFTREHCISLVYMIFICIYERKLYCAVYVKETCLYLDAPQNTLQSECIHVTFLFKDEQLAPLQLSRSLSFKTHVFKRQI